MAAALKRFEVVLLALFLACWAVDLLIAFRLVSFAGGANLSLYPLYGVAGALGSVAGHLYVHRGRGLPPPARRLLFYVYYLGTPSIVFLLRSMAPVAVQKAAPLVPLYAFGVFSVFFFVPVSLRRPR